MRTCVQNNQDVGLRSLCVNMYSCCWFQPFLSVRHRASTARCFFWGYLFYEFTYILYECGVNCVKYTQCSQQVTKTYQSDTCMMDTNQYLLKSRQMTQIKSQRFPLILLTISDYILKSPFSAMHLSVEYLSHWSGRGGQTRPSLCPGF